MDAILQYFINRWPLITFFVVATCVIVWIAILVTKHVMRSTFLEEKYKDSPCGEHSMKLVSHDSAISRVDERLEKLENRLEKVEKTIDDVKTSVIAIHTFLQSRYKSPVPLFSQKHSPRSLNDKGREVFSLFGGKEFIDTNEAMLCKRIEDKKPQTALDVEQYALSVLYETMEMDIFNNVKLMVYNSSDITVDVNGKETKYSITMEDICFIFSIELRDRYLNTHPEVPVAVVN